MRSKKKGEKLEVSSEEGRQDESFSVQNSQSLIPQLRFPEFREVEWVTKRLEDVAPLQRGFDLPSDLIQPGNIPIVYSNGIQKYHAVGMATAPGLVTGRSGTIGKLHFIEEGEYWPHNTSLWVTNFKGNVPLFVYYLYDSIGMGRFSSGSGVPTLNRNDVHAFSSPIPESPAEQQKIAECLSSIDEAIALQARKLDALKTHKKGLMQQLFPREGETQPRLRFPEFKEEWNDGPLEALCVSVSSGKDQREADGAYDLYGSTGVIGKTASPSYDAPHILVARVGVNAGFLTRAVGQFGVTDNTLVIRLKPSVNIDYIFYYLGNININKLIFGSGQPLITGTILKNLQVLSPVASEQVKISSCLSSLDELINAQGGKIEALKTHKKGLMQQLFPSPDEVES